MKKLAALLAVLWSVAAVAQPAPKVPQPKDRLVGGEVVTLSRTTILPNWDSTAKAVPRYLAARCFPTALEAANQLDYFFKILEIAKEKVPPTDPIVTGQPARKAEVEKARMMINLAARVNDGCPEKPVK